MAASPAYRLTQASDTRAFGFLVSLALHAGVLAAYGLWTWLLKRHPANQVAPFGLGVPVVGLLAGMWMLDERLSAWQVAGIGCIGLALLYVMFARPAIPAAPR